MKSDWEVTVIPTQEGEAGGAHVREQPGLPRDILSLNKQRKNKQLNKDFPRTALVT